MTWLGGAGRALGSRCGGIFPPCRSAGGSGFDLDVVDAGVEQVAEVHRLADTGETNTSACRVLGMSRVAAMDFAAAYGLTEWHVPYALPRLMQPMRSGGAHYSLPYSVSADGSACERSARSGTSAASASRMVSADSAPPVCSPAHPTNYMRG